MILRERQANVTIYLLEKIPGQMKTSLVLPLQTRQKKSKQNKDENQHLAKILGSKDRKPKGQRNKAPGTQSDNSDCGKFFKTKGQGYLSNNYMGGTGSGMYILTDQIVLSTLFSECHCLGNKKYNAGKVGEL